jgi:hypothetical protein
MRLVTPAALATNVSLADDVLLALPGPNRFKCQYRVDD